MSRNPKTKTLKHKIITGLATLSVITGVGVNATFDSPDEILISDIPEPTPIVQEYEPYEPPKIEEAAEPAAEPAEEKRGFKAWVQSLPLIVRGGVVLPLYGIGVLVTHVLGTFFSGVMAPVLASILKWVVLAAVIFGAVAIVLKLLFPDIPMKKLLSPKLFLFILLGVALIQILDKVLPLVFNNYESWANALKYTLGLCVSIIVLVPTATALLKKHADKKESSRRRSIDRRPLTPPYVPFGIRRFNQLNK